MSIHEINVVLVVENVRATNVHVDRVVRVSRGTTTFKIVSKCLVHSGVLVWVETVGEGRTVADTNSVGPR